MNTRFLIDGIVQQTMVLIAQISTAAGVRAPLAHIADQVFLSLARELDAQGVGRKVAADMFGLALRTYQKKTQRIAESASARGQTLWEAMHDFIAAEGSVTRDRLLERFRHDEERVVIGVLGDLVSSGLVYSSGRASRTVYGMTSDADRRELSRHSDADGASHMIWAAVYHRPQVSTQRLIQSLPLEEKTVRQGVDLLLADGRLRRDHASDDAPLTANHLYVPVGAEQGWEAALYDHFCAVAKAMAAKVRAGRSRSDAADRLGGATLRFYLVPGHPYAERVYGLLQRTRDEIGTLWSEVAAYNEEHAVGASSEDSVEVCFYFGQSVAETESEQGLSETGAWS